MTSPAQRFTFNIDPALKQRIRVLAAKSGLSISSWMQLTLRREVQAEEQHHEQTELERRLTMSAHDKRLADWDTQLAQRPDHRAWIERQRKLDHEMVRRELVWNRALREVSREVGDAEDDCSRALHGRLESWGEPVGSYEDGDAWALPYMSCRSFIDA